MSISFLYSSIFIVVRWADLILGFFGTYSGTLRRSGSGISSIFTEEYSVPVRHFRTGRPVRFRHLFRFFLSVENVTFLWRPSLHPPHKTSTTSPTASPTDRCHFPLASLYTSNKTKKPRCPANTTLPDARAKGTNVKRIFTIHFATCS